MTTTTFDRASGLGSARTGKGLVRRMMDRFVDAQMHKAQLRINAYLQSLDDKALAQMGYTPADIQNIRRSEASISTYI